MKNGPSRCFQFLDILSLFLRYSPLKVRKFKLTCDVFRDIEIRFTNKRLSEKSDCNSETLLELTQNSVELIETPM